MSDTWLKYVNLSDAYERRARFLPAILTILFLLPLVGALGAPLGDWVKFAISGLGLGAIVSVGVSHLASACGNRVQRKIWPDWPHDSPTNRWLHPKNTSVSSQQKQLWYHAIKNLTQIDIDTVSSPDNDREVKATINDALGRLRGIIANDARAKQVRRCNIDYGFSRNLLGLQVVWLPCASLSFIGCSLLYYLRQQTLTWALSSIFFLGLAILSHFVLRSYVRQRAEYYALSLFNAALDISGTTRTANTFKLPQH